MTEEQQQKIGVEPWFGPDLLSKRKPFRPTGDEEE